MRTLRLREIPQLSGRRGDPLLSWVTRPLPQGQVSALEGLLRALGPLGEGQCRPFPVSWKYFCGTTTLYPEGETCLPLPAPLE